MLLHWSHLIDSILLLLAALLTLLTSEEQALQWLAIALGPISLGLLAVAIAWATAPFTNSRWRWLVPALAEVSPAIIGYALPGIVHHHIPVATACVMMAGSAVRSAWVGRSAGHRMGAWSTVGIWLTPESMPFLLASFGGLGLFWSRHPEDRNAGMALRAAGTTFFILVAAALAVDPPLDGYFTAETYRLSVVYLVLAAIACANGWTVWWLDRQPLRPGLCGIIAVLVALSGLALWLALFPAILAGPEGLLSAEVARVFMRPCTARGFWDTELKPTPPEHAVEGAAGDIQPG